MGLPTVPLIDRIIAINSDSCDSNFREYSQLFGKHPHFYRLSKYVASIPRRVSFIKKTHRKLYEYQIPLRIASKHKSAKVLCIRIEIVRIIVAKTARLQYLPVIYNQYLLNKWL